MSDSITKYHQLIEDGEIDVTPLGSRKYYDQLQLAVKLVELARKFTELEPLTLYEIAKEELRPKPNNRLT